jgi:hypothetical protein
VRRTLVLTVLALALGLSARSLAADPAPVGKPETHDGAWLQNHGRAARADEQSCLVCHSDRTSCIQCHQDTPPRSHTPAWVKRSHGLEARFSRESCAACHREDSCTACHQTTPPSSHRPGWNGTAAGGQGGQHCLSCHYPVSDTSCFTCHKVAHAPGVFPTTGTQGAVRR